MKRRMLSWRFVWREGRSGELRLLWLALLVAVCATSSVSMLADRVTQGMSLQNRQLLTADGVLLADTPLPEGLAARAQRDGLQVSRSVTFPSMVSSGQAMMLASLRAIPGNYPLRGVLRVRLADGRVVQGRIQPAPGEIWADTRLLARLDVRPGARLRLGLLTLRLGGELLREPDQALNAFNFMPRVLLNQQDLAATGLLLPGARANWRLMVSGEPARVRQWLQWARPQLPAGARIESAESAQLALRQAMDRVQRFLGLSAMLTVTLAAAAALLAVRRYLARHWQQVAVLRCLGMTRRQVTGLFAGILFLVGLLAGACGSLAGYGLQEVLARVALPAQLDSLPPPSRWLLAQGPLSALLLLLGLAVPPLLMVQRVPPMAVLRAGLRPQPAGLLLSVFSVLVLLALSLWQVGEPGPAVWLLVAILVYALLAGGLAWGAVQGMRYLSRYAAGVGWRFGMAAPGRRPALAVLQVLALSLGLMALLTMTVVRTDLLQAWRASLPADTPNQFVLNLQEDQLAAFSARFRSAGLPVPETAPMVRGRLIAINDRPIVPTHYADSETQRLLQREFNLSWRDTPPPGNQLVAGQWWSPDASGAFSVEQGLARKLGIRLGDRLTFDLAGTPLQGRVMNLRQLAWDSFRVNFFVLATRPMLASQQGSLVASFYLPPGRSLFATQLVQAMPNLTLIDVSEVLAQVREIIERLAQAIEALFVLTLMAGLLVLWAALGATRDERLSDAALLRALGASRQQLLAVVLGELLSLGAVTGLIAGSGAMCLGALAGWVLFDLPWHFNGLLPLLGMLCGMFLVPLAGWPICGQLLRQSPLRLLRDG
ncbi:FtsX-like permease family protein [Paludibacterium sp. THUN1379]|uniref:ABC transporter permease n=1 Tax=Paludibacterium sp. THUN1379 TaxID=3112107 RepID=UPI0030CCB0B2